MPATNLLNWEGTRASLNAALAGADAFFQAVGAKLLASLDATGGALDNAHASNAAYTAWRDPIVASLTDVDSMCVVIDGLPANTELSDPTISVAALRKAVEKRANAARQTEDHPLAPVVTQGMAIARPAPRAPGQKDLEAVEGRAALTIAEATALIGVL